MDKATIERLRRRARDNRDRELKLTTDRLEAEYQKDLEMIRRLAALDAGSDDVGQASDPAPSPSIDSGAPKAIGPAAATREAIRSLKAPFTVGDIDSYIQQKYPGVAISRLAISSALNKFGERHVRVVVPKRGREGAGYEYVGEQGAGVTESGEGLKEQDETQLRNAM